MQVTRHVKLIDTRYLKCKLLFDRTLWLLGYGCSVKKEDKDRMIKGEVGK